MKILAIETATESCSAALLINGEIQSILSIEPRKHSELILKMMDDLLAKADLSLNRLDALAFGCGPGSFTGVRIACGVIQGAAYGADLPVIPISTLQTLAQGVYRQYQEKKILVAVDARMNEIYWGKYQLNQFNIMTLSDTEKVMSADLIEIPKNTDWVGAGDGWTVYADLIKQVNPAIMTQYSDQLCEAQDVALLAVEAFKNHQYHTADTAIPVYLRNKVAKKAKKTSF